MKKNKYSTPLLMIATILAGMLSPMQSAVNGQLGHWLQDGNACAVISFASGLVVMFFIIMARKETRQQFAAIPSLIKNKKVPLWNWFAGLCGAMVVFSEGASASALGVATFQTALISALLLSGLLCDRFGIGVDEKKFLRPGVSLARFLPLSPRYLSSLRSGTQPLLFCWPSCHSWRGCWQAGSLPVTPKWRKPPAQCLSPLPGILLSAFACLARRWRFASRQGMSASSCRTSGGCISAARWG